MDTKISVAVVDDEAMSLKMAKHVLIANMPCTRPAERKDEPHSRNLQAGGRKIHLYGLGGSVRLKKQNKAFSVPQKR